MEWLDETGYVDKKVWDLITPNIRNKEKIVHYCTTANVRLRSRFAKIMLRITSYICKRCAQAYDSLKIVGRAKKG